MVRSVSFLFRVRMASHITHDRQDICGHAQATGGALINFAEADIDEIGSNDVRCHAPGGKSISIHLSTHTD